MYMQVSDAVSNEQVDLPGETEHEAWFKLGNF